MDVLYRVTLERLLKRFLIVLRISPGTWNRSNIYQQFDIEFMQNAEKLL